MGDLRAREERGVRDLGIGHRVGQGFILHLNLTDHRLQAGSQGDVRIEDDLSFDLILQRVEVGLHQSVELSKLLLDFRKFLSQVVQVRGVADIQSERSRKKAESCADAIRCQVREQGDTDGRNDLGGDSFALNQRGHVASDPISIGCLAEKS